MGNSVDLAAGKPSVMLELQFNTKDGEKKSVGSSVTAFKWTYFLSEVTLTFSSTFSIWTLKHTLGVAFKRSREVTQEYKICLHALPRTGVGEGEHLL